MRFWSLCRSGLAPAGGRASWRVFRAAVASCGLPVPFVRFELAPPFDGPLDGRPLLLSGGCRFSSGSLFRCEFSASRVVSPRSLWVRACFVAAWLWSLPVLVTSFREDPFFPAPSRWVAFRDAIRFPLCLMP